MLLPTAHNSAAVHQIEEFVAIEKIDAAARFRFPAVNGELELFARGLRSKGLPQQIVRRFLQRASLACSFFRDAFQDVVIDRQRRPLHASKCSRRHATIPSMPHKIPFRHRAHEVTRVEAFSDVVFGFSISLLVVSLEAPRTYAQMMETLRGFLPFAVCFWIFIDIWFEHRKFFKRYALEDNATLFLNTCLLFVILFYVYPLKYMFTLSLESVLGHSVQLPESGAR